MFSRTRRISLIRYVNQLDKDYKFSSSTVISCRSGKPVPAGTGHDDNKDIIVSKPSDDFDDTLIEGDKEEQEVELQEKNN